MEIWPVVKWIAIIWLGPHVISFLLKFGAMGAIGLTHWLDKWPL